MTSYTQVQGKRESKKEEATKLIPAHPNSASSETPSTNVVKKDGTKEEGKK